MALNFSSASWTLDNIITEARGITGRVDASMMSDAQMTNFANFYYQNVLPKELKIFWGYTYYQFFTVANQDQYPAPAGFQTFNPRVTIDGFGLEWYESPDTFFQDYPEQENRLVVGTGNGTQNSFTFQIAAYPILARSVYVTDGTQIAQDVPNTPFNGTGYFVDPLNNNAVLGIGAINYATGTVTNLSFAVPPANNTNITCVSQTYIPARPQGVLFYKTAPLANATAAARDNVNMFVMRPVPGLVHKVKLQTIQVPPALTNLTDVPFRPDLGPLIALGMSLHIFKLFNQMDQYNQYLPEYNRFKDICMQDTYEEYLYQRSVPTF